VPRQHTVTTLTTATTQHSSNSTTYSGHENQQKIVKATSSVWTNNEVNLGEKLLSSHPISPNWDIPLLGVDEVRKVSAQWSGGNNDRRVATKILTLGGKVPFSLSTISKENSYEIYATAGSLNHKSNKGTVTGNVIMNARYPRNVPSLTTKNCPSGHFSCDIDASLCVPQAAICNGKEECPDGSDEGDCGKLGS
jgi:hypothetical protein